MHLALAVVFYKGRDSRHYLCRTGNLEWPSIERALLSIDRHEC